MMATKCAPFVGFATPSLSSVAKATRASCILPESSWRSRRRLTPALHIRLLEVACGPPLANIRPICAFHAQTSMRTSGLSLQPGALPGKGSAATLEATDGLSTGKSTRLGTVDSCTFALGAILSRMPYFFRLYPTRPTPINPMTTQPPFSIFTAMIPFSSVTLGSTGALRLSAADGLRRRRGRLRGDQPHLRLELFDQLGGEQPSADFVDATIFGRDEMYITEAAFADFAPRLSDYTYMDIYYRSIRRKPNDWLTARGYIWRWDTDWFWCSKHFGVQHPAIRLFARPALNSRTYQRVMRLSQRLLPASTAFESVIQDVDIPMARAAEFCEFLLREIGISPVWVCPFKSSNRTYDLCPLPPNQVYVNFGFWDMVPSTLENGYYNRLIERKIAELGGVKGLYSASYYDRDTFWSIYDKLRYGQLKQTYDAAAVFPDLYAKCVERQ